MPGSFGGQRKIGPATTDGTMAVGPECQIQAGQDRLGCPLQVGNQGKSNSQEYRAAGPACPNLAQPGAGTGRYLPTLKDLPSQIDQARSCPVPVINLQNRMAVPDKDVNHPGYEVLKLSRFNVELIKSQLWYAALKPPAPGHFVSDDWLGQVCLGLKLYQIEIVIEIKEGGQPLVLCSGSFQGIQKL
jgi:hypothetical protein